LIGNNALIDDGILQVVCQLDRSVVIDIFHSSNEFMLDLLPTESASLADDTDLECWYALLGHLFKANINHKL
jgi:hypothetical protein